jgi:hypothetical protein
MSIIKRILFFITTISAVGIAYGIYTLKSMPDAFDFTFDEDEDDREI